MYQYIKNKKAIIMEWILFLALIVASIGWYTEWKERVYESYKKQNTIDGLSNRLSRCSKEKMKIYEELFSMKSSKQPNK